MAKGSKMTVKTKIILMLLIISLAAIVVVGYLGWNSSRDTLTEAVFNQLTSVRAAKAYQIEFYFRNLRSQIEILSQDETVVGAMMTLSSAFHKLNGEVIHEDWDAALESYYRDHFFARLKQNISGAPNYQSYGPKSPAARYLQYHYIAADARASAAKNGPDDAQDGSEYSRFHARYHPFFRAISRKLGYPDVFLIDIAGLDIIYTVSKEVDFATNLASGPYAQSNLAEVVEAVRAEAHRGAVQLTDFKPYRPSYEAPAAFFATPIFNGDEIVGILALQLPVDEMNQLLSSGQNWRADGLGRSGQTYLVGSDLLMRSVSRALIEDPKAYEKALRKVNAPAQTIERIERFNTSILQQKVDTEASWRAIEGESGTRIVQDYRHVPAFSSYGPLRIEGVDWAILTEKEVAEAYRPVRAQQRQILISGVILILLITFIAIGLAHVLTRPLASLIASAQQLEAGQQDVVVESESEDEFGQLGRALTGIAGNLRQQNELIELKNHEHRMLLDNVLPRGPAERLRRGEEQVAERARQVTVLFASVVGFAELSEQMDATDAANQLNALWGMFDEVAESHGVKPHQTMGERYLAVCGLAGVYLDHTKRMLDFSLALLDALRQFNTQHQTDLHLRVGIHSGPVVAAIIGARRFRYDLWGETVNIALSLHAAANPDTILVSQQSYEQVRDLYRFDQHMTVQQPPEQKAPPEVWALEEKVSHV